MKLIIYFILLIVPGFAQAQWIELGGFNTLSANNTIFAMCSGPSGEIYAGGLFTNVNGKQFVAKWDGTSWI